MNLKYNPDTCGMKYVIVLSLLLCFCSAPQEIDKDATALQIDSLMNQWHSDAANANLNEYVGLMDSTCVYIGTDATENWIRDDFAAFCKPYFDQKTTWDFTTVQRKVRVSETGNTAWFDEILDTHMGTCRGSGALELKNGKWKLMQYVLSIAIPNESMEEVKVAKHTADSILKIQLK
ncbi:MAG: nuclear transport factor 2 family protein [Bacteroidota bacterium]|jgi:hypothetical protein|tara:strand:+ start:203 stop:733 length:531 start_codon:yes stop_codon:yes gene_type:complete